MEPVSNADKLAEIRRRNEERKEVAKKHKTSFSIETVIKHGFLTEKAMEDIDVLLSEIDREKSEWLEVMRREQAERRELLLAIQSIQQERDEELLFPRQADRIGDWVISPKHLEEVSRNIENYHGDDAPDYTPSLEQIEMVLLAVERMAKSE